MFREVFLSISVTVENKVSEHESPSPVHKEHPWFGLVSLHKERNAPGGNTCRCGQVVPEETIQVCVRVEAGGGAVLVALVVQGVEHHLGDEGVGDLAGVDAYHAELRRRQVQSDERIELEVSDVRNPTFLLALTAALVLQHAARREGESEGGWAGVPLRGGQNWSPQEAARHGLRILPPQHQLPHPHARGERVRTVHPGKLHGSLGAGAHSVQSSRESTAAGLRPAALPRGSADRNVRRRSGEVPNPRNVLLVPPKFRGRGPRGRRGRVDPESEAVELQPVVHQVPDAVLEHLEFGDAQIDVELVNAVVEQSLAALLRAPAYVLPARKRRGCRGKGGACFFLRLLWDISDVERQLLSIALEVQRHVPLTETPQREVVAELEGYGSGELHVGGGPGPLPLYPASLVHQRAPLLTEQQAEVAIVVVATALPIRCE